MGNKDKTRQQNQQIRMNKKLKAGASRANVTQRGKGGVGSKGRLLDRIHVEKVECLGICLEPRGS